MSNVYSAEGRKVGVKCDICGKFIDGDSHGYNPNDEQVYYSVTTGHYDWGNDSDESREHKDICPACILRFVEHYLREATGSEYIEIEREYAEK